MFRRSEKGQSTAEYAIVIGLVIAAAIAMQVYVKRSMQAKMKDASDYNDPAATMLTTKQYEPDYQVSENMLSIRESAEKSMTAQGGGVRREISGEDVSSRTGTTKTLGVN
jgi:hypothetical protein